MRAIWHLLLLGLTVSCVASVAPGPTARPVQPAPGHPRLKPAAGGAPSVDRPPTVRREIGPVASDGSARVVIRNSYLTTQFVLVDSQPTVEIPPGSEQSFAVTPGAHTITVSDGASGEQNAQYIAEVFDAGFAYRYEVVAR